MKIVRESRGANLHVNESVIGELPLLLLLLDFPLRLEKERERQSAESNARRENRYRANTARYLDAVACVLR